MATQKLMESFSIFVVRPELVHFAGNQIQFDFCAHYTHRALQKPLLFFFSQASLSVCTICMCVAVVVVVVRFAAIVRL